MNRTRSKRHQRESNSSVEVDESARIVIPSIRQLHRSIPSMLTDGLIVFIGLWFVFGVIFVFIGCRSNHHVDVLAMDQEKAWKLKPEALGGRFRAGNLTLTPSTVSFQTYDSEAEAIYHKATVTLDDIVDFTNSSHENAAFVNANTIEIISKYGIVGLVRASGDITNKTPMLKLEADARSIMLEATKGLGSSVSRYQEISDDLSAVYFNTLTPLHAELEVVYDEAFGASSGYLRYQLSRVFGSKKIREPDYAMYSKLIERCKSSKTKMKEVQVSLANLITANKDAVDAVVGLDEKKQATEFVADKEAAAIFHQSLKTLRVVVEVFAREKSLPFRG